VPAPFTLPLHTRCDSDVLDSEVIAMMAKEQCWRRGCGPLVLVQLSRLVRDHEDDRFAREKQRERNDGPRVGREVLLDRRWAVRLQACRFEQEGSPAYCRERCCAGGLRGYLGWPQLYS
jgi:hypothetical protein